MSQNQIQAGSSVESLCKRCKTVTDHHVVVMDKGRIAKVECKICLARHAYQSPSAEVKIKQPAAPKAPRTTSPSRKQSASVEAQWEKSVADAGSLVPYSMAASFRAGDVMDHPVFGLGAVQKFVSFNTVEVLFRDGLKNLRCAPRK
ncbi:MAG: hypothetical protein GXY42_12560 [Desulfovibrionales bacterium]|nr:hypothetical protein [Desulfovibrionales bacterium]